MRLICQQGPFSDWQPLGVAVGAKLKRRATVKVLNYAIPFRKTCRQSITFACDDVEILPYAGWRSNRPADGLDGFETNAKIIQDF